MPAPGLLDQGPTVTLWDATKSPITATMNALFGETVVYTQTGKSAVVLLAIFTERFQSIDMSGEVPIQSTSPVFDFQLADLGYRPRPFDQLQRDTGDVYEVTKVEPDGEGGVKVYTVAKR